MDVRQTQISELNQKIDQLYTLVERISSQVNTLASDQEKRADNQAHSFSALSPFVSHSSSNYMERENCLTHKDILVDDKNSPNNGGSTKEQNLSPEIQIRRLTAQLTAAYNRIAALEEQLLSRRIKS